MIADIIQEFATPFTVRRTNEATTFVDGLAQVTTDVDEFEVCDGSVQPLKAQERMLMPELIRDRGMLKIYTKTAVRSVDVEGKKRADRITYGDQAYVVQSVEDWDAHGDYYKIVAVKEDD